MPSVRALVSGAAGSIDSHADDALPAQEDDGSIAEHRRRGARPWLVGAIDRGPQVQVVDVGDRGRMRTALPAWAGVVLRLPRVFPTLPRA